jgi:hypothetical protein
MANINRDLTQGVQATPTVTITHLGQSDLLWVADAGADQIQVRAKDDLGLIAAFGSTGSGNNQFNAPWHLACDLYAVYVNDYGNVRLKKHVGTTLAFVQSNDLAPMTMPPVSNLAVDKRRLLAGKSITDTYVYCRHKNTLSEEHVVFDCGAGGVVGLAVTQDHFYVADATRIEKRLLSDGSLIATWNTPPATFAVNGLTTDGTYVYALVTKAATDARIVRLYCTDLTEYDATALTAGKQQVSALCCDAAYLFYNCIDDNTVNRIDIDLDAASLLSRADVTSPMGLCCLPPYFTALRPEPVATITASASMAMTGAATAAEQGQIVASASMAPAAVSTMAKNKSLTASASVAMSGTTTMAKVKTLVASASLAPSATSTMRANAHLRASASMAPSVVSIMELGTTTPGDVTVVDATVGLTATTVTAAVRY